MKFPKLFVIALSGCLLLGASSANAELNLIEWKYLACEGTETTEGTCVELDGFISGVSRCVLAVKELQGEGWRLQSMERILDRTTLTLFSRGFELRTLYCILDLDND